MKIQIKKLVDKADDSLIDELIGKAESAMVSPFKKAKPETEEKEEAMEQEVEETGDDDSIDPEELQKLVELYKSLKD